MTQRAPLAIVGIGCRFPGADGPDALWRVLTGGVDCIREVPPERWDAEAFFDPDPDAPGRMNTRFGGFVDHLDRFDPRFFGIADRDVREIDPQQRLLLQVVWHALEDAGLTLARLAGSRTGVFIGISHSDYAREIAGPADATAHATTGTALSISANRISFWLDLRGPSLAVDTACSSSLVAVHLACQSLWNGECEAVVAGGVNVILTPDLSVALSKAQMMAPDGRCKTFDAGADGYVRGEGGGIVVIKPLDQARADGDRILALIRGSAVGQDGRSNGITAPNPAAQEDVVRRALRSAGVAPSAVSYVELHGTGTLLGDPIEAKALGEVLAEDRREGDRCAVGSIKTNIGHLEAAAGVAGLIKTVLALHHRVIPPSLHFRTPNPYIPFDALPLRVQTECGAFGEAPAIAGVSSFGFGGTNCHIVLEEADGADTAPRDERAGAILALSAASAGSLAALASDYDTRLAAADAVEVCAAACARRSPMPFRLAVAAGGIGELRQRLQDATRLRRTRARRDPRLAMLFGGQGSQYAGMGQRLYEAEPLFRETIDALQADVFGDRGSLDETARTQPALVALELALAHLWIGWGVEPDFVIGHSLGEIAAACVAGACEPREAVALATRRGALMQSLRDRGAIAAVACGTAALLPRMEGLDLEIAAINGADATAVAGDSGALAMLVAGLKADGIAATLLPSNVAFHNRRVEPILDDLERAAAEIDWRPLRIPMISTVSGAILPAGTRLDGAYWRRQTREPVRFADAVAALAAARVSVGLEASATPVLAPLVAQTADEIEVVPSLRRGTDDVESILAAAAALFEAGASIDLGRVRPSRRHVALPPYPFEQRSFPIHRSEATRPESAVDPPPAQPQTGSVLTRLRSIVVSLLGTDSVDDDAPFIEMGADSILLLDAVRRIEREFHVRIPLRAFFAELSTIDRLAAWLQSHARDAHPSEEPATAAPSPNRGNIIWGSREVRARSLTPQQQRHLDGLAQRFATRTKSSKELAQRHRAALADSRAAAGFRFTTKEMLYPIVGSRATGSRLWDLDGNEYIDLTMGFGVHLFGHQPGFIDDALRRQLDEGMQLGPQARLAGETAELIRELTGHERVAFCTTGTEAVMLALRVARTATGRQRVAVFSGSYHGHSDAMLAEAEGEGARPGVAGVTQGAAGDTIVLDYGSEDSLRTIERRAGELAAVLVEPVQSRRPDLQPREFLHRLREITAAAGVLLIFDEMITGFRIAPGGAQEHFGVRADLCTYGKIIGGGMPIGVVAGRASCMDAIDGGWWQYGDQSYPAAETTFFASTFARHPLALAAAHASLLEIRRRGPALHEELNARTASLAARLERELEGTPLRVVRFGSLFRFAFSGNQDLFFYHLVEKGLYVWEGRNCFLSTAHTAEDLDGIVEVVRRSAAELRAGGFFSAAGEKTFALSPAQRQLVALAQLSKSGSVAYNIPLLLQLDNRVDPELLRESFGRVVKRHEALRLQLGDETQRAIADPPFAMTIEECADDEALGRAATVIERPFDFSRPLVPRAALYRTPVRTLLLLVFHHAVVDGLSLQTILNEASVIHEALALGEEPRLDATLQFPDWLQWQDAQLATEAWDAQRAFRMARLAGMPPAGEDGIRSYDGGRVSRPVSASAIRTRAAASGCTPFMVSLASYAELLHRLWDANDFVVGVPVAGRGMAGSESLVGYCTHLLPIRFDFSRRQTDAELREMLLAEFENADYPYARLIAGLRTAPVRATFNLDRVGALPRFGESPVVMLPPPVAHARFDLGLNVTISGETALAELDYKADLFTREAASRILDRFAALLEGGDPLTADEHEHIARWRGSQSAPDLPPVHQRIEVRDSPAVVCGARSITYAELDARARELAAQLPRNARIAIVMPRSIELIVNIVAVLHAGSAYVPIEPSTPPGRLSALLDAVDAAAVLSTEGIVRRAAAARADGIAYILFTSGSTGHPKPVAVSHRAIASYCSAIIKRLALPPRGHYAVVSTFSADLGNTMVFPALCQGGTLHVIDESTLRDPEAFSRAMEGIDCLKIVPSHLQALAAEAGLDRVLPRTHLILGGEAASPALLEALAGVRTTARIINHYGPTECTVGVMTGELRAGDAGFAFEAPLASARIRLTGSDGADVLPGTAGEIRIGGDCLADGYLGMPEATAERFVIQDGERFYRTGDRARLRGDGRIELLGRSDEQLKIRGYRIEPGEIASVLARCEGVSAVHVGALRTAAETPMLVAWYTGEAAGGQLDAFARQHFTDAMVPSRFVRLAAMPLTANGKIDRERLPRPDEPHEHAASRNEVEETLAGIWRDVLRRDVGIDDHFFEIGGDSILGIQVAARARRAGLAFDPLDLYRYPTISGLARVTAPAGALSPEEEPVVGEVALLPAQRWFFEQEVPSRSHWNMSVLLEAVDWITPEMLAAAFTAIVAQHNAFRLRFECTSDGWHQRYGEARPVVVEWIDAADCDRVQRSLDITDGDLLRVAMLRGSPARVLVVVHHLVMDGVSWRIVIEDLQTALAQLRRSVPIDLGTRSSSLAAWSRRLTAWSPGDETELWTVAAEVASVPLPRQTSGEPPLVSNAASVMVSLDETHTETLLHRPGLDTLDVLLTALLQTITAWSGEPAMLIELEAHGRESLFDGIDVSRTIGWFTSRFPVWLLRDRDDPLALVASVREQIRSVPHHGIGYGALRYLRDDDVARMLRDAPVPEIAFNYLGQFDHLFSADSPLRIAHAHRGEERDPHSVRRHLLAVDSMVVEGRLSLTWTFSASHHDRRTIERVAAAHCDAIAALLDACPAAERAAYTPIDFTAARLDQRQLDEVVVRLRA